MESQGRVAVECNSGRIGKYVSHRVSKEERLRILNLERPGGRIYRKKPGVGYQ